MATKTTTPVPVVTGNTAGLSKTFSLAVPIHDDAGKTWTQITLIEPELRHRVLVQRAKSANLAEQTARMLSVLSDVPETAIRRMKQRDARACNRWIEEIVRSGIEADVLAEASGDVDNPFSDPRTFDLMAPVATDAQVLTTIMVREPDIETGIAIERMDLEGEKTAALIAACSGLVIPLVMRLRLRDVARLERYFDFFFEDGATAPPDRASANGATPAGAMLPSP
ncbi:MAG: phage tail assembly protein [Hyphomicrobium sp.]|uniref:phage tail assembly protein n=1 Tax=Hyphomicrobium sp. TaxID=82 RepID=UPI00132BDCC2|nr:phage tail assembly protein [Hyphomicrobium sp.]KAB2942942.1 MAG: phage tail assembly protein [Hyphomicrobium sp.]MBZ0210896.1 phage tail assembly protein [Hyphomicrobium sp.]